MPKSKSRDLSHYIKEILLQMIFMRSQDFEQIISHNKEQNENNSKKQQRKGIILNSVNIIKIAESTYFQWIQRFFCSLTVKDGIIYQNRNIIKVLSVFYSNFLFIFRQINYFNQSVCCFFYSTHLIDQSFFYCLLP